jgi:hypothetical protein
MNSSFQQTLVEVWRQVLIENAEAVELDGKRYSVRVTPRKGLRQVDFVFDGNAIRGLEQKSRDEITVGGVGSQRQEGDAIPEGKPLCGECR